MLTVLSFACLAVSAVLMLLVLAHRGSGGGLSDLLGGSGAAVAGSASASKNLTRITWLTVVLWASLVLALAILNG